MNSFKSNITEYTAERCTNIYDESAKFRKDKKKLARISSGDLDLLMEQVFVCLQFGYLDFANPHYILTALAGQHQHLGCYTIQKPENMPKMSLDEDFYSDNRPIFQSEKQGFYIGFYNFINFFEIFRYLSYAYFDECGFITNGICSLFIRSWSVGRI